LQRVTSTGEAQHRYTATDTRLSLCALDRLVDRQEVPGYAALHLLYLMSASQKDQVDIWVTQPRPSTQTHIVLPASAESYEMLTSPPLAVAGGRPRMSDSRVIKTGNTNLNVHKVPVSRITYLSPPYTSEPAGDGTNLRIESKDFDTKIAIHKKPKGIVKQSANQLPTSYTSDTGDRGHGD